MKPKYSDSAEKALKLAARAARQLKQNYIGTEHLLAGLVTEEDGVASRILAENGLGRERIMELMAQLNVTGGTVAVLDRNGYSPRCVRVLDLAAEQAERYHADCIGTEHLLLAILLEGENVAMKLLETVSVNLAKIYFEIIAAIGEDPAQHRGDLAQFARRSGEGGESMLAQYSRDLTAMAAQHRLDPVVGREREIARVIQILSRRTKNNPCLIGEPGVGKTAIVEGLAERIVRGDVPDTVRGKRILTLDLAGMIAGSKYRGEFEERIKKLIAEVMTDGNVLLFLDELHTVIGAGGAEGAIDASNILKPSLARGELQMIGATTITEYRKHIEKDAALERRFQPVTVDEPTAEEAVDILRGIVPKYEQHHQVEVTDDAILAAVELSSRYINERNLPDKAIDVIDEACSLVRLGSRSTDAVLERLEAEFRRNDSAMAAAVGAGELERARELREENDRLAKKLRSRRNRRAVRESLPEVNGETVARVIADWAKVPVTQLTEKESERLVRLEGILHERVIGQSDAVKAVAAAIRRGRVGLQDPNRPIGSFLFLGPTGVGKTELSKALAEAVFGSEKNLIRVDMSEYMEQYAVSKMIGSAPGYVGYDDGGQLSEQVRRHPYSVVLFDEIEKAHHDVFNVLLQILDDGRITDSQGHTISFKNTIIIMTSNVGAMRIIDPKTLGFSAKPTEQQSYERMKSGVMEEVRKVFRPEFINRIDEIQVFHPLTTPEMIEIAGLVCAGLEKRAAERMGLSLRITAAMKRYLVERYADPKMGARPLKRAVQTVIENPLTDRILSGEIREGSRVTVGVSRGRVTFQTREEKDS
ncbi:ATP-dependent Clp protease ATP-binding subunit [Lachnoclostridium sp. Marseille-P6806]|uniref:ATP-dependent Clp protease ATP-binding subunit n=1 Tax=Lachnoclostridium sp. Marseille-P6806 TaxID=2364793 RepID=UPI00103189FF|nr:ATP-dependent Clp protease ATP-binding subunit [Lachnoclostridium sp. Marseille-P6806]